MRTLTTSSYPSPPLVRRYTTHLDPHTRPHALTHLLHAKSIPLRRWASQLLLPIRPTDPLRSITPNKVLNGQPSITGSLEYTTRLERPRDLTLRARKEEPHLEGITDNPIRNDTRPESLASPALPVRKQLWQRQGRLNRERHGTEEIGVRYKQARGAQQQMQDQQHAGEVGDEGPVWTRAAPLPEVVRALAGRGRKGVLEWLVRVRGQCAVCECDVQEEDLNEDGQDCLDEERGAEVRAEPVEDPVV
jgi:hypothetical protein